MSSLYLKLLMALLIGLSSGQLLANEALMPGVVVQNQPNGDQTYSLTLQILALMTVLTLLPALLLTTTAFARIIIVL